MVVKMKKKTKFQLRKEIRRLKAMFLTVIHLQCYDCQGFFADGYADCGIHKCPLYPFQMKKGQLKAKPFKALANKLKALYKQDLHIPPDYWLKVYKKENLA